jgi:hypothetical protein
MKYQLTTENQAIKASQCVKRLATGWAVRGSNPQPSRPAPGPNQPPVQWVPSHSRGKSGWGVALATHPHLGQRFKRK